MWINSPEAAARGAQSKFAITAAHLLNALHNNFLTLTGQDLYLAVDDTIDGLADGHFLHFYAHHFYYCRCFLFGDRLVLGLVDGN